MLLLLAAQASGDELTRAIAATSDPEAEHDLVALGVIPEEILKKAKENLRREGIETAGLGAGAGAGESEEAAAAALGDTGCVVKGYVFLGDVQGKDSGAGIARAALKKAWTQWRKNRDEDADEENDSDAPKLREWMVVDGAAGDIDDAMNRLGRVVYRLGEARLKTRTMLCQIYHHAVHDRVDKARELLLMSRIQDIILHTNDVLTQVLYNRALTQVGLACFREGRYRQAYFALRDLAATNNPMYARERMRELLAQGTGRQKRSEEEEKEERRRRIPAHMHINLDVVDAAHTICAMLLEVPNMAAAEHDASRSEISRHFRALLAQHATQTQGPPETPSQHIVAASAALTGGDWRRCVELLMGLPMWARMVHYDSEKVCLTLLAQQHHGWSHHCMFCFVADQGSPDHGGEGGCFEDLYARLCLAV